MHTINKIRVFPSVPRGLRLPGGAVVLIVVLALPATPAGADGIGQAATSAEESGKDERAAPAQGGKSAPPLNFTDEDLERFRRPGAAVERTAVASEKGNKPPTATNAKSAGNGNGKKGAIAPDDPLRVWKEREAEEKKRAEQLQSVRDRISSLESRLEYLQQKRLAIVDPLRIMPQAPSADDRQKDGGLGSRELLGLVEKDIQKVEADLKSAGDDLIAIQTRAGS